MQTPSPLSHGCRIHKENTLYSDKFGHGRSLAHRR